MSQHAEPVGRFYAFLRLTARFWIWFLFREVAVRQAGARPGEGPRAPLRQPSQQPDRLAPRRDGAPAQGPLPRQRVALPQPDPRPLPDPGRRHPRLPAPGGPRPAGPQCRDLRRLPSGAGRGPPAGDLSRRHHPRRDPRAAHQDGRGPDRARLRDRASGAPGIRRAGRASAARRDSGRALLRGSKVLPGPGARRLRRAASARSPRGAGSRGAGGRRPGPDRRHPERDGGRGRPRRPDRRRRGGPGHRGSLPGRAGPPAPGRAGPSSRGHRRLPSLPGDRRGGGSLPGTRSRPACRNLAADPALPGAARRVARARPGGGSPAPGGRASPPPALVGGSPARPPGLRLRRRHERAPVSRPALAGPRVRAEGDGLRDDPPPRERGRLSPLLGPRDLARRGGPGNGLGARVRGVVAPERPPRLPLPPRPRPAPREGGLRRPRLDPPPGRGPAPGRAPGDPHGARASKGGLSCDARCRARERGSAGPAAHGRRRGDVPSSRGWKHRPGGTRHRSHPAGALRGRERLR